MIRRRLFDLLTALAVRGGRWVFLVVVVLTALSLWVVPQLQVLTNFKDLLGDDDPVSSQLDALQENFAAFSSIRVLIEGRDADRLLEVGEQVAERLSAREDLVRHVTLEQPVDFFVERSPLFLEVDDLRFLEAAVSARRDPLAAALADPSVLGFMGLADELMQELARPADAVATVNSRMFGRLMLGDDPMSLPKRGAGSALSVSVQTQPIVDQIQRELVETMRPLPLPGSEERTLKALGAATDVFDLMADVLEQGERLPPEEFAKRVAEMTEPDAEALGMPFGRHAFSPARTSLLLDVYSTRHVAELAEAREVLGWMQTELDDLQARNPDISLGMAGFPVMQKEESEVILDNFLLVSLLGLVGILAVFIIGFERVGLPSLAVVPLLLGTLWTFALVTVVRGQITLFAMTFPVLLFGIGIDFAIHMLAGYSEQRKQGLDPEQALRATFDKIGAGLLTGALTTSLAFMVLLTSSFYGLRDMGFTAGFGVLLALVAMLTVLPAIVVAWDRRQQARGEVLSDVPFSFLAPLGRGLQRHRYPVLAGFLVVTLTLGYFSAQTRFDDNYLNLLPDGLASAETQAKILEEYGSSNDFVVFVADDLAHAERLQEAALSAGTAGEVFSASALIPSNQSQKAPHIQALGALLDSLKPQEPPPAHRYDAEELERLRDRVASVKVSVLQMSMLSAVLYDEEVKLAAGALRDAVNRLDARINPASAGRLQVLDTLLAAEVAKGLGRLERMSSNTSLQPADLPDGLRLLLQGEDERWLVMVRGDGDVWDSDFREAFLEDMRRIDPTGVGSISAWQRGLTLLLSELPRVFGVTALVVALLVLMDLRSVRATVLAMVPLGVGLVWTLGVLGLLGLQLNIISVVAIPLLVGIGIDNGVHIYHRIRKERSLPVALERSGKPVLLTSMTTAIGFGSLMLSVHPGLHGLGLATTIGIASCLVVSLFLLPALVAIFDEDCLDDTESI